VLSAKLVYRFQRKQVRKIKSIEILFIHCWTALIASSMGVCLVQRMASLASDIHCGQNRIMRDYHPSRLTYRTNIAHTCIHRKTGHSVNLQCDRFCDCVCKLMSCKIQTTLTFCLPNASLTPERYLLFILSALFSSVFIAFISFGTCQLFLDQELILYRYSVLAVVFLLGRRSSKKPKASWLKIRSVWNLAGSTTLYHMWSVN